MPSDGSVTTASRMKPITNFDANIRTGTTAKQMVTHRDASGEWDHTDSGEEDSNALF